MNKKTLSIILSVIIIITIVIIAIFAIKHNETSSTSSDVSTPSSLKSSLTISDVISKIKDEGYNVTLEETKPYFTMIGAIDGEMFYLDNEPVKLYIFESEKSYKEALNNYPLLQNMPKKDLIVLDTNISKIIELFKSL